MFKATAVLSITIYAIKSQSCINVKDRAFCENSYTSF